MLRLQSWMVCLATLLGACDVTLEQPDAGDTETPEPESPGPDGGGELARDASTAEPHDAVDGSVEEADSSVVGPPAPDASLPEEDASTWPPGPLPDKRVVPIYITASDESEADTERHIATYNRIMEGVRAWYSDQLASFGSYSFYTEQVRVLHGNHTRAQWDDYGLHGFVYPDGMRTADGGGCAMYYGTEHELRDRGLLAAAGLPPLGTAGIVYYAIAGGGTNGSCGAGGYLAASELALLHKAEATCPTGRKVDGATDCAPVGAIAHELGHGFGLPHGADRPTCSNGPSLMDEWWRYEDGVGFCSEDYDDLLASGFFSTP